SPLSRGSWCRRRETACGRRRTRPPPAPLDHPGPRRPLGLQRMGVSANTVADRQRLARRGRGVGGGLRLLRLPRGALLLASGGVVLLFVGEHLCGQAPLIPDRGGGVADRAGPVAGIRDDVLLVGPGVVGHPGVLRRGPAGRARRARMHVTARIRDEEGPVPAAPDPERLLEPVNLFPGTLRLLTGRLSVTQGLAESRPGRLGRSSA